ncbi:unnamed protein product [Didymodactylos carnosus]|uniref:Uncharacterized protein n=1 Tax=Didymodactylos carnosus TaxID=1234261 RepID=A0A815X1I5_9BILA|nr:unnamed protein product [Didymodactylos carnosus]CAF1551024.1 unnamed protein product [Didymodactylos carnosus]CAF4044801.1 unnamed protein product [Didymodactylos carnosus]CAF4412030.1 unnamed protein product [Didymodactylos carnosus]
MNSDAYDTDGGTDDRHHLTSRYGSLISPQILRRHDVIQMSSPQIPPRHPLRKAVPSPTILTPQIRLHHGEHEIHSDLLPQHDVRKHIRNGRKLLPITAATPVAHTSSPAQNSPSPTDRHHMADHRLPLVVQDMHEQKRQVKERIQNHPVSKTPPLRFIFIRHSERVDQTVGSDWFSRAFDLRTGAYHRYNINLPKSLPNRSHFQAYEFDPPLTVEGWKNARIVGRGLLDKNLTSNICLTSSALRCVQTCELLIAGMRRRERLQMRVEPGLFECPHSNTKLVDSFMTKGELLTNDYNIKADYKPVIPKITVPETLEEYFQRSQWVMQRIIDRYKFRGGNVLIVTHAPGLIALTDALQGIKSNPDTLYRVVSRFQYLATRVAEFENGRWNVHDQPFDHRRAGGE